MQLISFHAHGDTVQTEFCSDSSSAVNQIVLPACLLWNTKQHANSYDEAVSTPISDMCRVLSYLDRWGHQAVALESFSWMETHSNSEQSFDTADPFLYTRLMSMCRQTPAGYKSALQMFHNMQSKGIEPDLVAYNTAINAAGGCPVVMRS